MKNGIIESYEDLEKIKKIECLKQENRQLKELLKECKEFFHENLIGTEFHFSCGLGSDIKKQSCIKSLSKLKTKMEEVLK